MLKALAVLSLLLASAAGPVRVYGERSTVGFAITLTITADNHNSGRFVLQAQTQPGAVCAASILYSGFTTMNTVGGQQVAKFDGTVTWIWEPIRSAVVAVACSWNAQIKQAIGEFELSSQRPAATPTQTTSGPIAISFGDGIHKVGFDVIAGTYRTVGQDGCYWARVSDLSGNESAIVTNDNAVGPAIVTISPRDAGFISQGCGIWKRIPLPKAGGSGGKTHFGDGTYRFGVDVTYGTYHSAGMDGCYFATLSGFNGTDDDIVANDNASGPVTLTLQAPLVGVVSSGCGMWSKI